MVLERVASLRAPKEGVEGTEADKNSGPLTTTATFSHNTNTDSAALSHDTDSDAEEGGQYFVDLETGQYYYQVRSLWLNVKMNRWSKFMLRLTVFTIGLITGAGVA